MELRPVECELMPDGQPAPVCGERFVAVHPGDWTNQSTQCLEELYGLFVTVTIRLPRVPYDRIGPEIIGKAEDGLLALCERVRAAMNMSDLMRIATNALIDGEGATVNGFIVPLQFRDGGKPQIRSGAWFHSKKEPLAGLSQTMTFGGAQRDQLIESQV